MFNELIKTGWRFVRRVLPFFFKETIEEDFEMASMANMLGKPNAMIPFDPTRFPDAPAAIMSMNGLWRRDREAEWGGSGQAFPRFPTDTRVFVEVENLHFFTDYGKTATYLTLAGQMSINFTRSKFINAKTIDNVGTINCSRFELRSGLFLNSRLMRRRHIPIYEGFATKYYTSYLSASSISLPLMSHYVRETRL